MSLTKVTPTMIAETGNQPAVTGVAMGIQYLFEDSAAYPLVDEAGIWPGGPVETFFGVSKTFNSTDGGSNAPCNGFFAFANNNNCPGDVVAVMGDAAARTNGDTVFGGNLIARCDENLTNVKLVGLEIDVEFGLNSTSVDSGGLYINIFNIDCPGPAILIGDANTGGTFGSGLIFGAGIASNGTAIGISAFTLGVGVDLSQGTYNDIALLLGTGVSKGIKFGTAGGGSSPITYGDASGAWITQMGTNNYFVIKEKTGANNVLVVDGNGNIDISVSNGTLYFGNGVSTGTATAGAATLPAKPVGFLNVSIGGTGYKLPYYAA